MISFLRLPIEKLKDHEGLRKQEGWERTQDPEGWGKQGEKYQIQKTIEGENIKASSNCWPKE